MYFGTGETVPGDLTSCDRCAPSTSRGQPTDVVQDLPVPQRRITSLGFNRTLGHLDGDHSENRISQVPRNVGQAPCPDQTRRASIALGV
jgi:hypothetical protein